MDFSLPRQLRYDFLVLLLGVAFFSFPYYFLFVHPLNVEGLHLLLLQCSFGLGIGLFVYGFALIHKNYIISYDLSVLEAIVKKKEIINRLKQDGMVTHEEELLFYSLLKQQIADFLQNKPKSNKWQV